MNGYNTFVIKHSWHWWMLKDILLCFLWFVLKRYMVTMCRNIKRNKSTYAVITVHQFLLQIKNIFIALSSVCSFFLLNFAWHIKWSFCSHEAGGESCGWNLLAVATSAWSRREINGFWNTEQNHKTGEAPAVSRPEKRLQFLAALLEVSADATCASN